MSARIPTADVVRVRSRNVTIACPYCAREHTHAVLALGLRERRAPACGMFRSPDDRAAGYRFSTVKETR